MACAPPPTPLRPPMPPSVVTADRRLLLSFSDIRNAIRARSATLGERGRCGARVYRAFGRGGDEATRTKRACVPCRVFTRRLKMHATAALVLSQTQSMQSLASYLATSERCRTLRLLEAQPEGTTNVYRKLIISGCTSSNRGSSPCGDLLVALLMNFFPARHCRTEGERKKNQRAIFHTNISLCLSASKRS